MAFFPVFRKKKLFVKFYCTTPGLRIHLPSFTHAYIKQIESVKILLICFRRKMAKIMLLLFFPVKLNQNDDIASYEHLVFSDP